VRQLGVAIGPAVVPDAIDPALQHGRQRPPPDRKDEGERIVPGDARLLLQDRGAIAFPAVVPIGLVGLDHHGVEALAMQVGDFHLMAGGAQPVGEGVEYGAAERLAPWMAENGQDLHG
jgi:hypothetical protein